MISVEEFFNKVHSKADGEFINTPGTGHVKEGKEKAALASDKKAGVKVKVKASVAAKVKAKPAATKSAAKPATKPKSSKSTGSSSVSSDMLSAMKGGAKPAAKAPAKAPAKGKMSDADALKHMESQMEKFDLPYWNRDKKALKTDAAKMAYLEKYYAIKIPNAKPKAVDPVTRVAEERTDRHGTPLSETDPFNGKPQGLNHLPPPAGVSEAKLSDDHLAAIINYRGEGYMEMNPQLRGQLKANSEVSKVIKDLDSAFEAAPRTTADIVVYRALRDLTLKELGNQFTDNGFVSTAYVKKKAQDFSEEMTGDSSRPVIAIRIKKGSKVLKLSDEKGESEILLPRGAKFTKEKDGSFTYG